MADLTELAKTVGLPLASGITSFAGAFLRFKQRLADAETKADAADKRAAAAERALADLRSTSEAAIAGLKSSNEKANADTAALIAQLRADFQRDKEHREELEEAREEGRASRRDPIDDLRLDLEEVKRLLERNRERVGKCVRNEQFTEYTKGQEALWREIGRTLGRLEALTKS